LHSELQRRQVDVEELERARARERLRNSLRQTDGQIGRGRQHRGRRKVRDGHDDISGDALLAQKILDLRRAR